MKSQSVYVKNIFNPIQDHDQQNFDAYKKKIANKANTNKLVFQEIDTNKNDEDITVNNINSKPKPKQRRKIKPLKNVIENKTIVIDYKLQQSDWQNNQDIQESIAQYSDSTKSNQKILEIEDSKRVTQNNGSQQIIKKYSKKTNALFLEFDQEESSSQEDKQKSEIQELKQTKKKFMFDTTDLIKKLGDKFVQKQSSDYQSEEKQSEKQQQQNELTQNMEYIPEKRPNLLINFDDDSEDIQSAQIINSQCNIQGKQVQNNSILIDNRQPQNIIHHDQTIVKKSSKQVKNVFLQNFDSDSQNNDQNDNSHSESTTKINLSRFDDIKSKTQFEQQNIEILRPININEFMKLSHESLVQTVVPKGYILQTIVKRSIDKQGKTYYEMFDSTSLKSIFKVLINAEGYWFALQKQYSDIVNQESAMIKGNYTYKNYEKTCAVLISNFFGTQFNCYKLVENGKFSDLTKLNRLLTIQYETNLFGLKGPRKMQIFIPGVDYLIKGEKNLKQICQIQNMKTDNSQKKVQKFINKTPKWNSQISAFVLNFNGRATVSSVKNFIITKDSQTHKSVDEQSNYLLFGKINKDAFNLDIKYPFTLIQALALALSSFDRKLACE